MRSLVMLPQVSPNDETAEIVEWLKLAGQSVRAGETLCQIETTKSIVEVVAETAGHVYPIHDAGSIVATGTPIAVVSDTATESEAELLAWVTAQTAKTDSPATDVSRQARWTKKAEIVARRHGLAVEDIASALGDALVTEAGVIAYLESAPTAAAEPADLVDDVFAQARAQRILVLGGGDGAVQVLDAIAHTPAQRAVAILDDNQALHGRTIMGVPVLGALSLAASLWSDGRYDAAVVSISTNLALRARIFGAYHDQGIPFANVIAPWVSVHSNAVLGQGNLIMSFCRIGACARIGDNNFLSAYVNLEHHNELGSHCTFGPMVTTSGRVHIGDRVSFGAGVSVEPHLHIGSDCLISSGAVLVSHVPAHSVVKARLGYSTKTLVAG